MVTAITLCPKQHKKNLGQTSMQGGMYEAGRQAASTAPAPDRSPDGVRSGVCSSGGERRRGAWGVPAARAAVA